MTENYYLFISYKTKQHEFELIRRLVANSVNVMEQGLENLQNLGMISETKGKSMKIQ